MAAEIICVGTELLLGDILNSNAQFLAQQLAALGIPHYYQTVVGDNPTRLCRVIQTAIDRGAELLIFTGGLGPTPDDLTCETLAQFFDAPLIEDPEIVADIAQKYAQRGRVMNPTNRKQALIPQGAMVLPNPAGTAPGIIWQPRPSVTLLTFPGVPSEMQRMWRETAIPYLQSQGWGKSIIYSRTLKFWGIPESELAQKVRDYFDLTNPTVAPYAGKGEVKLRISAQAPSLETAQALIAPVEAKLREMGGMYCYGADEETLASVVGKLLQARGQTLSVAESCTGGGLGQMITAIAGSSSYFTGGAIAYNNSVKIRCLQVNPEDLATWGAVSATVAQQMARGVQQLLGTHWGLSITGIAGPDGGTEEKPVGLVYIGLAKPNGTVESFAHQFGHNQDRSAIRHLSACGALDHLRRELLTSVAIAEVST
ncbi:competence/damage-inducible protein A [Geitlerinema calcuttense]|uniref:CinA-like protein n=1 Tax=Geitlerinema calcuttense NRMC-F 0142 TaxID=2922238 RepID=A0ABT7M0C4_9CYAN|nr:competence/damage-inducible protein A [Geitlerinema calcuttense]MDL5057712.1 competence/damage-inducible protein A [Geitlerinema calcuttense NRMC-F 0142]